MSVTTEPVHIILDMEEAAGVIEGLISLYDKGYRFDEFAPLLAFWDGLASVDPDITLSAQDSLDVIRKQVAAVAAVAATYTIKES